MLNFSAFDTQPRHHNARAYVAPLRRPEPPKAVAWRGDTGKAHATEDFSVSGAHSLIVPDVAAVEAEASGFRRAHDMLAKAGTSPGDLYGRIVTALSWAGRARLEFRREQAHVYYVIALEALLSKPTARSKITKRLASRAARVVGMTADAQRRIGRIVRDAYNLRSQLVHTGDASRVSDFDLQRVRVLARAALGVFLTDARFISMSTEAELEAWFAPGDPVSDDDCPTADPTST